MTTFKTTTASLLLLLAGMAPAAAYPSPPEREATSEKTAEAEARADLERSIREQERQVRDLTRKLAQLYARRAEIEGERAVLSDERFVFLGSRPMLGVVVRTESEESDAAVGAVLEAVTPGGPAAEAGLRAGDVITSVNGRALLDEDEEEGAAAAGRLIEMVRGLKEGEKVELEYRRGAQTGKATVTPRPMDPSRFQVHIRRLDEPGEERTPMPEIPVAPMAAIRGSWLDVALVALNEDLAPYFKADGGVLVVSTPREEGLQIRGGDVIVKIGEVRPRTAMQAVRTLRAYDPGEEITLQVVRRGDLLTLKAKAPEISWQVAPPPPPAHPKPARPPKKAPAPAPPAAPPPGD